MSAINTNTLGGTSGASNTSAVGSSALNLKPTDFVALMVTQLQHQDPTQPTSNQDLLAQMSQIGQLQSSTDLQATLGKVSLQTEVGSASSLIGKSVAGLDANNKPINGTVNSVQVAGGNVSLQLDNGSSMSLDQLSTISPGSTTTTSTTGS